MDTVQSHLKCSGDKRDSYTVAVSNSAVHKKFFFILKCYVPVFKQRSRKSLFLTLVMADKIFYLLCAQFFDLSGYVGSGQYSPLCLAVARHIATFINRRSLRYESYWFWTASGEGEHVRSILVQKLCFCCPCLVSCLFVCVCVCVCVCLAQNQNC